MVKLLAAVVAEAAVLSVDVLPCDGLAVFAELRMAVAKNRSG